MPDSFLLVNGMKLLNKGRIKILTDEKIIDSSNIIKVLQKSFAIHCFNAQDIQSLFDYELGEQPLAREKTIRPEIDIEVSENAASYVTDFKKGYFWGIPPVLIQHGDREMHETDPVSDDTGIAALNEMMLNGLDVSYENQMLGDFVEKCGVGHRLVDIKTDFTEDPNTYVTMHTLDSRYSFCVYYNGVGQKKVLGVTYVKTLDGKIRFTCYTNQYRFDIGAVGTEWSIIYPEPEMQINPLGMIPIVEFNRAIDRTGAWERHISYMDGLNVLISDFENNVAQITQQIWWGDNVNFEVDKNGNAIKPESGDWLLTYSGENKKASVQPLVSSLDGQSTLSAIGFQWNRILQKCHVPVTQESVGGGSTGTATSMATGWQSAEVDALREEAVINKAMKEELRLILKAIEFVPESILPMDAPIRKVHASDVDMHYSRNRNYDLSIKANTLATLINTGMDGRDAIKLSEIAPDAEQVWLNSKHLIEGKQYKMFFEENTSGTTSTGVGDTSIKGDKSALQDLSMQSQNSPFIGSLGQSAGGMHGKNA